MKNSTERIFGSRTRSKVLSWFFMHHEEQFFVRQLATILKEDSTNLSRELINLEKAGVLLSSRQGTLKYFQTNRQCPFFSELKGLVLKTVGVAGELKAALKTLPSTRYAFLFGSYARGEEGPDSDIDLLIIGETDLDRIESLINTLEHKIGRTINYVSYTYDEYLGKKKAGDGFLTDVIGGPKIMLVGDEGEFEAV